MKKFLIPAIALLISGCVSITDHSREPRFSSLLGVKTLTHDGLLCKREGRLHEAGTEHEIVWQKENKSCYLGETIKQVKRGDEVEVFAVLEQKNRGLFRAENWYLVGTLKKERGREEFYFLWGSSTTSPEYPQFTHQPRWQ